MTELEVLLNILALLEDMQTVINNVMDPLFISQSLSFFVGAIVANAFVMAATSRY